MKKVLIPTKLDSIAKELLEANGNYTVMQDTQTELAAAPKGRYPYPLNILLRRLVALATLPLAMAAPGQATDAAPLFSLAPADVPKLVIIASKPDHLVLEVTYTKPRQAELAALTADDLPKVVRIAFVGQIVSSRTFTLPSKGHSLKIDLASLDDAFANADALGWPLTPPSVTPTAATPPPGSPVFDLTPSDASKLLVFLFKPNNIRIALGLSLEKRAALGALASAHPSSTICLTVDDRTLANLPASGLAGSGDIRIDLPSASAALDCARLFVPTAPARVP